MVHRENRQQQETARGFIEKYVVVALTLSHTPNAATSQEKRQNCFVFFPPNLFNRKASKV